jgi:hypothetical protein
MQSLRGIFENMILVVFQSIFHLIKIIFILAHKNNMKNTKKINFK